MNVSDTKLHRICIVSEQLAGGGAERCSALLSQFLMDNNCLVHHVIVIDKVEYEFSGELLNLGKLKKDTFNFGDRIKRFKVLKDFFRQNTFDFIIDTRVRNRQWQEFFITNFIYNAPLIVVVHSYMTNLYFPKNSYLSKNIFSKSYKIIAVSKAISEKIVEEYCYNNVETIYNPIDFKFIDEKSKATIEVSGKYILAVGRMNDTVKQFDILINCYAKSELPKNNIKLIILGDGKHLEDLKKLSKILNLEDKIVFEGNKSNPFPYYKNALYTVLSSRNEGFPNVLLESLYCETPVISFNCLSGPNEIITNRENGILVENQNQEKLSEAMNELYFDENLYYHCKQNAKQSVLHFSLNKIGNEWLKLMKIRKQ